MSGDVILGSLKATGLLDVQYFQSIQDLLSKLPSVFVVEMPAIVGGATVGNTQPGDDARDRPWYRFDNAGNFIGIYVYALGNWRQVAPAPNQLIRMIGDSRAVPEGYQLADAANPKTASVAASLQAQWIKDPTATYWVVFDVTFDGY